METKNVLQWRKPTHQPAGLINSSARMILEAETKDADLIQLWSELRGEEDDPHISIVVLNSHGRLDTDRTIDWPEIERRIPRDEWPVEIWAGKHGSKERNPDPAIVEAIRHERELLADD